MDDPRKEDRRAPADHPIHELIRGRWSPYAFAPEGVPVADLLGLFEAARWAPSSFNEQPWRYLAARREDGTSFGKLLGCLMEPNRVWAQHAGVLVLTVARTTLTRNGKPNGKALHDVGLASAQLTVEAAARGLAVHQMGGILPDRAREEFGIPADFEPVTALAIGRPGDPGILPESLRERDGEPRVRRALEGTVFGPVWGEPAPFLEESK
ncbi:MAG: nitroreductase family protein [Candidatus Krumholzibacteriia bacterium]